MLDIITINSVIMAKTSLITRARNKVMCYSDMAKGLLRWGYKMSSKMGRGLVPA